MWNKTHNKSSFTLHRLSLFKVTLVIRFAEAIMKEKLDKSFEMVYF